MAIAIELARLNDIDRTFIQSSLELKNGEETDECFVIPNRGATVNLPFAFAKRNFDSLVVDNLNVPTAEEPCKFTGLLKSDQRSLYESAVRHMNVQKSLIVAAYPGFGKTIVALKLASLFDVPTVIVTNKIVLVQQWKEAIVKFTSYTPVLIDSSTIALDFSGSNCYIVNAINIGKHGSSFWAPVKFLIVDELHQIVTKVVSKLLLKICPRYLLGLSATPYRFDEYDKAIEWFFGKTSIGKELDRKHFAYCVETNFTPVVKYTKMGIDWNAILNSQMLDDRRNELIVDCVSQNLDRTWLILVKRVNHADLLVEKFAKRGLPCETLLRTKQRFDKSCKILIGTTSKIGVGFDHAAINALCIAADVKNYFVQFLGRCMRTENVNPIVFDFDDDFGPLRKHFVERVAEYKKHGGIVTKYVL